MRRIVLPFGVAAVTLAVLIPTLAQPFGSPIAGRRIATAMCGSCHQVTAKMPIRNLFAPTFEDIANLSSTTALSLKVFLRSNHNKMPNLIISQADTDDLIAYILSLKRR